MAEVVTALTMANAGFKLAMTLYSFAEAVGSVDKEIIRIATDITLFSYVLEHLADVLDKAKAAKYITKKAFETVQKVIAECKKIYQELDVMIQKSTKSEEVIRMKEDETVPQLGSKMVVPFTKRLLYFFQRSKLEALRAELISLKTNLNVLLGTLAIAQRIEETRKSGSDGPDLELAKGLRAQDRLKMKCLVMANEAAAADVRKLTKAKNKHARDKSKTAEIGPNACPSIASEGVLRELSTQSPLPGLPSFKPADKSPSSVMPVAELWSPISLPAAAKKDPEEPNISVQDTNAVVLALFALWVSNGAQLGELDAQSQAGNVEKRKPEMDAEADEEEEMIDLFPRRESRPY